MDFKCDELILRKTDADSRALTIGGEKNYGWHLSEIDISAYNAHSYGKEFRIYHPRYCRIERHNPPVVERSIHAQNRVQSQV